ncbi:murein biosynthesis integral membrane protein MurJ [Roseicitreum antarcticum]|uniref:Probable lipid II flippase MurJ n=1 Tax=Roseicitreum antarcticum TaxID=564137 RepID=A0A1H2SIJ9_9RHOB|nr:murein biosynthesis integral membrane protein MurJ [Roseicitreum antarcticum]SDW31338.1 putative peptidoglycan lipid II flippase [Roseicitreum antarcticum]
MAPIRLVRGFLTVGLWTMLSRVLGFVRDVMIAAYLGTGPVAEAFYIAFSLPNMFRRFFAEGAFNMAFIPMFSKKVEGGDNPQAFAREAFSGLATVLIVFSTLAILGMPWLVLAMASGFLGDARFDLAVDYGRIAFPYILFISLAALLSGVLNSMGRFAAAAAAPVLLNVLFVAALLLGGAMGWPVGETLVWAVPVAGVAQLGMLWVAASRAGFRIPLVRPRLTPDLRQLARIAAPAMLAGGVVQVNLLVGRQVASFFDGAVAWLYNADRLYQLPLGVVGIAIGVVLLPDLSRKLRTGDTAGGRHSFNRATEFSLAITVPCAVALAVISVPLVSVLFERGQFGPEDTTATALAVAVYGLGLPAFVLQKVLQPLFFAREDTRRPFNYAVVAMIVNAVIAIGLAPFIGYIAAAIGTSVAGWTMVWQLWSGSRAMDLAARPDARLRQRAWRIVAAAAVMGAVIYGLASVLQPWLMQAHVRYVALAGLIAAGALCYGASGVALGAFRLSDFRSAMRRNR